ncbi:hypothetical protein D3C87_1181150 [compost metagenome]
MSRARREVQEHRLVRRDRVLDTQPFDRVIGEIFGQVIVAAWRPHDRRRTVVKRRIKLIGFSAHEAVEAFETLTSRPSVEGAARRNFPVGRLMPFAKRGSVVAVLAQDFRYGRSILGVEAAVTRAIVRHVLYRADPDRMRVATGQ